MKIPKPLAYATLFCLIIPLICLIAGLVFFLTAASFDFLDFYNEDEWTQAEVENFMGAKLPSQQVDFDPHCGIDCFVYVRVRLTPAEADQLFADLEFEKIAADPNNPYNNTPLTDGFNPFLDSTPITQANWWQPQNVPALESRGGHYSHYLRNRYYTVLVDQSDPALYVVYLTVAST